MYTYLHTYLASLYSHHPTLSHTHTHSSTHTHPQTYMNTHTSLTPHTHLTHTSQTPRTHTSHTHLTHTSHTPYQTHHLADDVLGRLLLLLNLPHQVSNPTFPPTAHSTQHTHTHTHTHKTMSWRSIATLLITGKLIWSIHICSSIKTT